MEGLRARGMLLASTVLREIQSSEAKSFFLSEHSANRPALYHSCCTRAALNSRQKEKGDHGGITFHWVPRARNCLVPGDSLEELHRAGISYRTNQNHWKHYKIVIFVLT